MGTSLTATGVQFPDNRVQTAPAMTGFRNKIINGNMAIGQRGASFTINNLPSGIHTLDRFKVYNTAGSEISISQEAAYPNNEFSYSLRSYTTIAKSSLIAGDYSLIEHVVEGYNITDLIGNTFTVSFWVKSNKVGLFSLIISESITAIPSYPTTYTINSANVWEKKTITISGGLLETVAWGRTNGAGLRLRFSLAAGTTWQTSTTNAWVNSQILGVTGQVNMLDTVGNTLFVTGVQLEKGSVATDFEHRPYGLELSLCQRYCLFLGNYSSGGVVTIARGFSTGGTNGWRMGIETRVTLRSTPVITFSNLTGWNPVIGVNTLSIINGIYANQGNLVEVDAIFSSNTGSSGSLWVLQTNSSGASWMLLNSEL